MFSDLLISYDQIFPSVQFSFRQGDKLSHVIRDNGVPEKRGVYVFFLNDIDNVVYVGKAGTLGHNGWSSQTLARRLKNKQQGLPRRKFFEQKLSEGANEKLIVRCWVTFDGQNRVLPSKAEADLLQAYFEEFGGLPQWNRKA